MYFENLSDILSIEPGQECWKSKAHRVGYFRFLLFAFLFGDWNKVHINPVTYRLYRSHLGGLTCCGDLVLSMLKADIHKVFSFLIPVEIIALQQTGRFKRPLHPRTKFYYRYVLVERHMEDKGIRCLWRIDVLDSKTDKLLTEVLWELRYLPVQRSEWGRIVEGYIEDRAKYPFIVP